MEASERSMNQEAKQIKGASEPASMPIHSIHW